MSEASEAVDALHVPDAAAGGDAAPRPGRLRQALGPLGYRDYALFLGGSSAESIGVWVYLTAIGWLALELTNSAFMVSLVNVAWFTPFLILALPSGVVADRFSRRKSMIVIRIWAITALAAMTVLAFAGGMTYFWLCFFTVLVGASNAMDLPVRQAFVGMLVKPNEMVNAMALNASNQGFMRLLGPLLAGFMLVHFGGGGTFAVYGIAQAVMLLCVIQMHARGDVRKEGAPPARHPLHDLKEGLGYIRHNRDVNALVALAILTGMVGWVYIGLMPVIAREVLNGDSVTLGYLSMSIGLGGLPVALTLAFYRDFRHSGRAMFIGLFVWGACVILFAFSSMLALSIALLCILGLGFTTQNIFQRSLTLEVVDREFHGRVFGVLSLTWGANIFGTLAAGTVAETLGVTAAVAGSGALILIATAGVLIYNPRLLKL